MARGRKKMLPVNHGHHAVIVAEGRVPQVATYTLVELARRCGCRREIVARFVAVGLIDPVGGREDDPLFEPDALPRLAKALRLRRDLGLHLSAVPLVVELLDRIEELEERLQRLV